LLVDLNKGFKSIIHVSDMILAIVNSSKYAVGPYAR